MSFHPAGASEWRKGTLAESRPQAAASQALTQGQTINTAEYTSLWNPNEASFIPSLLHFNLSVFTPLEGQVWL